MLADVHTHPHSHTYTRTHTHGHTHRHPGGCNAREPMRQSVSATMRPHWHGISTFSLQMRGGQGEPGWQRAAHAWMHHRRFAPHACTTTQALGQLTAHVQENNTQRDTHTQPTPERHGKNKNRSRQVRDVPTCTHTLTRTHVTHPHVTRTPTHTTGREGPCLVARALGVPVGLVRERRHARASVTDA